MSKWTSLDIAQDEPATLAALIREARALVVGIGAGMSAADGFTYIGDRFETAFPDFIEKYGFLDMLQASLFPFAGLEEYWAFQSRFIALNYLDQPVGQAYLDLKEMLETKPYHIITTNADNAFQVADYDHNKVFHIQGEYGLWQCSQFCHQQTYRDDLLIRRMVAEQKDMKIPRDLIPYCPKCGAPFEINKRNAEKGMVEDADFLAQKDRYERFLAEYEGQKILYLEIGVGYTTPQFIKHPFQAYTRANPNALFVTMNQKQYRTPPAIQGQTVQLTSHIAALLAATNRFYMRKGEHDVSY
ncbi:deacetylase SIR2 [Streptococcus azizii]|uniref:Deacetylase SIR2 n=1 Tax=Streptococcus azizii TaxID=1579424 RepID=A0AB36JSH8_9STRE|nr:MULTISPECIES: NAD-dependent deacetylase [Streptococcus]MBF0775395.1 NAD-dependent deacetylase [Streptococcus sp. 19428wD3_AN2]ONK26759.1 deacetylase SIR2 [Streptococcus azizii]ONK27326.1 deacetylase SIR2 [Streptococcus azizii]ONK28270.1 deacetylase SIR2 [Streptococcus azizii]TFU84564.1 NAD-dependent deacetylase [Streptococcus sp. AN2]